MSSLNLEKERIISILTLYDYKLPYVVAEYFCYAFMTNISCKKVIKIQTMFRPFLQYKNGTYYVFELNGDVASTKRGIYVNLTGLEFLIEKEDSDEFMENNSNMIL